MDSTSKIKRGQQIELASEITRIEEEGGTHNRHGTAVKPDAEGY
ncbi:hypothetical protein X759_19420 [Mesorhizobium sp. LSHC420B00]|nr:hypothetical protein X759_19420 [Mesorhizobium sp. LSHC420B00]